SGAVLGVETAVALPERRGAVQVVGARRATNLKQADVVLPFFNAVAGQETAVIVAVRATLSVKLIDSNRRIDAEKRVTRQETREPRYTKETPAKSAPNVLHHEAPMSKVPPPKVGRRLAVQVMSRAVPAPAAPVSAVESERGAVK